MKKLYNHLNPNNPIMNKLLMPAIERSERINEFTQKEKIEYIKQKYNLTHGKGKRKRRKK